MKDALNYSLGGAAIANVAWFDLVSTLWQVSLSVVGAVVLLLTARSKWLEIKQRKRDLNKV